MLTSHQEVVEGPGGPRSRTHGKWSTPERLHRPLRAASEGNVGEGPWSCWCHPVKDITEVCVTTCPHLSLLGLYTHCVHPPPCHLLS